MMLKLLDYQFKVTYIKGKKLHVPDTLSREALKDSFESQESDVFRMELVEMDLKPSNVTADTLERIRTETSKDPVLSILNSVTNRYQRKLGNSGVTERIRRSQLTTVSFSNWIKL